MALELGHEPQSGRPGALMWACSGRMGRHAMNEMASMASSPHGHVEVEELGAHCGAQMSARAVQPVRAHIHKLDLE